MYLYRKRAIEAVYDVMLEAHELCELWCDDEEYSFDLNHIIAVANLILEEQERNRAANEG